MHVTVIVSDHGALWRHFPVTARHGSDRIYFFFDHRHPPRERNAAVNAVTPVADIDCIDVMAVDIPPDCDHGVHPWEPVITDDVVTAATCSRCGATDVLDEPYPGELRVAKRYSAAS